MDKTMSFIKATLLPRIWPRKFECSSLEGPKVSETSKHFYFAFIIGVVLGFTLAYVFLLSPVHNRRDHLHHYESVQDKFQVNDLVAQDMAKKVRVLCWVMTYPENHETRAKHVKATWGRRCNILLFMSSVNDTELPAIGLNVSDNSLTKEAFIYVYKHYYDQAEWFMKADDDTYVIVENLRYLLSEHNTSKPSYFGCRLRHGLKQGFMSGGAGYVLSKEALRRFVEEAIPNQVGCQKSGSGPEDAEIGICLELVGVVAMDTRDSLGRGRFFPLDPEYHLIPDDSSHDSWYWRSTYYPSVRGMDCCSNIAVSFHLVQPNIMYVLEYLVYHLRPYGIKYYMDLKHMTTLAPSLNDTRNS